jgi:hypothetical protein
MTKETSPMKVKTSKPIGYREGRKAYLGKGIRGNSSHTRPVETGKRNSICDDKEMEWYNNGSELKAKKSALARTTA